MRIHSIYFILLLCNFAFAWTEYTNVYVAKHVLLKDYPLCAAEIEEGVKEVFESEQIDKVLGEPTNFHCDSLACPAFDPNYCQTGVKSCPSETKAGQVKSEAEVVCNCEQAKKLAAALTYFIAKYDPMNLMVRESEMCRNGFDNAVEEAIKSGNATWSVEFKCDKPNRKFTFTSYKMFELLSGATSFAFAGAHSGTSPWFCYTLSGTSGSNVSGPQVGTKKDGELCSKNAECESGFCSNNVCCSGEVCCPVPNIKGYPCMQGEKCSQNYTCVAINAPNGEKCDYDEECMSGNCAPGSARSQPQYCCGAGGRYCCASDNDCVSGEKCISNFCTPTNVAGNGHNTTNQSGSGEVQPKEKCLPIAIMGLLLSMLYILAKQQK